MTLEIKSLPGAHLKALDEAGKGVAVIATLNVIDKDQDVTLRGAFGNQPAKLVPAHDWAHVPLGKAAISESGNEVLAEFQINMGLTSGQEWYKALKFDLENGPPLQEWSYGFQINSAEFGRFEDQEVRFLKSLKVYEISPVIVGAGVNTRTVAIKGQGRPFAEQMQDVTAELQDVIARATAIIAKRLPDGRDLSPERYAELKQVTDALAELVLLREGIGALLAKGDVEPDLAAMALVDNEIDALARRLNQATR